MGSNLIFLVIGIDSATSTYSCIWCKCSKEERQGDPGKEWSILDVSKGARTTEDNCYIGSKTKKKSFCVSHKPLFTNIPLKNVVIDNLHLFLRVTDVLLDLLVIELKRQDAIEKVVKFNGIFDVARYQHLKGYEGFVSSLKIPDFHFYVGRASKALKCRSFTGLKIMRNISIPELLPSLENKKKQSIKSLWIKVLELNSVFSKRPEDLNPNDIDQFNRMPDYGLTIL